MAYTKYPLGVGGGVNKDLPSQDLDNQTYTDLHNLHLLDGRLVPVQGYASLFSPLPQAPESILGIVRSNSATLLLAGNGEIHQNINATWSNVSRAVGGAYSLVAPWQSTVLNGCVFFNNGSDVLQVLEAGDTLFKDSVALPANFTAKTFKGFNNYLFALDIIDNVTELPQSLRWSDPADPGTEPPSWDVTDPTTQAGQVTLADTDGTIVDAMQLRDQLIIYKTDSVYSCQFIGGIYVFSFQKIISNKGALSNNCIASFEGNHFVVGFDDIYIHDGLQAKSIGEEKVNTFFYKNLDQDYSDNVFVTTNYSDKEVWICYPNDQAVNGECNQALVWNWVRNVWTTRDIPNLLGTATTIVDPKIDDIWDIGVDDTWDLGGLHWDANNYSPANQSIVGWSTGDDKLYQFNDTALFDDTGFDFYLEKSSFAFDDEDRIKHLNHLTPDIGGQGILSQRFGTQNHLGEGISWGATSSYTIGTFRSFTRGQGRYFSMKFFGNTADVSPSIGGLNAYLSVQGEK